MNCAAQVKKVHDEEWSYIPVGGPLPNVHQGVTAFGAAANLVHPATGYSIVRSLREAPALADSIAQVLQTPAMSADMTAHAVWDALWPREKRRQVSARPICCYASQAQKRMHCTCMHCKGHGGWALGASLAYGLRQL